MCALSKMDTWAARVGHLGVASLGDTMVACGDGAFSYRAAALVLGDSSNDSSFARRNEESGEPPKSSPTIRRASDVRRKSHELPPNLKNLLPPPAEEPTHEKYKGEINEAGEAHGHGVCRDVDGVVIFAGEWCSGQRIERGSERGVYTAQYAAMIDQEARATRGEDGEHTAVFDGEINADGQADGEGESRYADGGAYTGGWRNGRRSGHGTLDGERISYEGEWQVAARPPPSPRPLFRHPTLHARRTAGGTARVPATAWAPCTVASSSEGGERGVVRAILPMATSTPESGGPRSCPTHSALPIELMYRTQRFAPRSRAGATCSTAWARTST